MMQKVGSMDQNSVNVDNVLEQMGAANQMAVSFLEDMSVSASLLGGHTQPAELAPVNISEALHSALECSKLGIQTTENGEPATKKVTMEVVVSNHLSKEILSDRNKIGRNILNLLVNAVNHTKQGSITISADLVSKGGKRFVAFSIVDTGCGVGEHNREFLWEPFMSGSNGTGLGLFVVKRQSEILGGSCGMHPNPDAQGTSYFVSFLSPLAEFVTAWC